MDELCCPPGKSCPCQHFTLNPKGPFTTAGATFQPQTLFSTSGEAQDVSPGRELMEMSPGFSSENGGQSHGEAKNKSVQLIRTDRWDIIIYYKYFNV